MQPTPPAEATMGKWSKRQNHRRNWNERRSWSVAVFRMPAKKIHSSPFGTMSGVGLCSPSSNRGLHFEVQLCRTGGCTTTKGRWGGNRISASASTGFSDTFPVPPAGTALCPGSGHFRFEVAQNLSPFGWNCYGKVLTKLGNWWQRCWDGSFFPWPATRRKTVKVKKWVCSSSNGKGFALAFFFAEDCLQLSYRCFCRSIHCENFCKGAKGTERVTWFSQNARTISIVVSFLSDKWVNGEATVPITIGWRAGGWSLSKR